MGKVVDFGSKIEGVWFWKIELRRPLFGWGLQLWENFLSCLNQVASRSSAKDGLKWKSNVAAHVLAKLGIARSKEFVWVANRNQWEEGLSRVT
ncbi:hypothetical protein V6N11_051720 [Hibiscus sabdariffa]|uniref:Uncharacterized protein n=1 Tax=Hibiscus sabdariffa TaxID=183260 RepID=A0ABR2U856_9ROSI